MRQTLFAAAALAALAAAPAAAAAVSVFGETSAHACFEAARDGRTDRGAITTCDMAIEGELLSLRDRAASLVNRGVVRLHRAEYERALSDFNAAVRLMPDLAEAHVDRGAAQIMVRDYAGAIESITRGLDLGPQDPHEAHFNRGIAYEAAGDLRAAYDDYNRASALAPDWPRPKLELARFTVRSAAE
jgi:tetratricopeptide (TPR) repeat protein